MSEADKMFEELGYKKVDKKLLKNIIYTDGNNKIIKRRLI